MLTFPSIRTYREFLCRVPGQTLRSAEPTARRTKPIARTTERAESRRPQQRFNHETVDRTLRLSTV